MWLAHRPAAVLAACIAALAIATGFSLGAPGALGIGSMRLSDSPPEDHAELAIVLGGPTASRDPRVARVSADVVAAQVAADPAVAAVRRVELPPGEIVLLPDLGGTDAAGREDALDRLEASIDPGPLDHTFEGELPRLVAGRDQAADDLWRPEVLVLPLALLAAWAVGGIRGAVAATYCAALAITGSLALLRVAGLIADVSLLGFAAAAAVGLVLGVELGLLALRFIDQSTPGGQRDPRGQVEEIARFGAIAAAAATLTAFGLLLTPLDQAGSLVLGCSVAALLAAVGALCFVPALAAGVAALGRANLPLVARIVREPPADPGARRSPLAWIVAGIASRPVIAAAAAVLAVGALVAAGSPVRDASTAPFGVSAPLPADSLIDELPAAAAVAAVAAGAIAAAALRTPLGLVLGLLVVLPAGAALGLADVLFVDGNPAWLVDSIEIGPRASLDTGAVAAGAVALVAIAGARTAVAAAALRSELRLGVAPAPAAYLAARVTLPGSLAGTLTGGLAAGAMAAGDLGPAEELGIIIAVGLAADLLLVRAPGLAAAAWLAQIRWRQWPTSWRRRGQTASAG